MQKQIERIEYFSCGYCINHLHHMFGGVPKQTLRFEAGVFLLKHRKHGYILYDTGYGTEMKRRKLKYFLYHLANPFYVREKDEIGYQLREKGIAPEEIRYVILSHLHPDHIGGAKSFPNAKFIITEDLYRWFEHFRLRDLVFQELLPEDFRQRIYRVLPNTMRKAFPYRKVYDFFGDGSLLIASLDGHAIGQACVYLPEYRLYLAADVCWGVPLIRYTRQIRKLPLMIQKNPQAYFQNIRLLQIIRKSGIEVVVSHDRPERIRRILQAAGKDEYE